MKSSYGGMKVFRRGNWTFQFYLPRLIINKHRFCFILNSAIVFGGDGKDWKDFGIELLGFGFGIGYNSGD